MFLFFFAFAFIECCDFGWEKAQHLWFLISFWLMRHTRDTKPVILY